MARPQNPHPNERLDVGALVIRLSDLLALSGITGGTPQRADTINADRLGIDISEVNAVVLSHGHFEHAGGLAGLAGRRDSSKRPVPPLIA